MKIALMAASALAMIAAPAFAQNQTTVNVTGSVAALCGAGGHSSGGTSSNQIVPVNAGALSDSDGRVDAKTVNFNLANLWCNGPASLSVKVNPLMHTSITDPATYDSSSFFNRIDMSFSGQLTSLYFPGGTGDTSSAGTGQYNATRTSAFETGSGTYAAATLTLIAPSQDRPLAGDYAGTVVVTVTAGT
jgi:spore coat protein U-like protein